MVYRDWGSGHTRALRRYLPLSLLPATHLESQLVRIGAKSPSNTIWLELVKKGGRQVTEKHSSGDKQVHVEQYCYD